MIIFYRINDTPSPLSEKAPFSASRVDIIHNCLKSFVNAFHEVKPFVYFILDNTERQYHEFILSVVPFEHKIEYTAKGINDSCIYQYELFEQEYTKYSKVGFVECDYLWLNDSGKEIDHVVDELDFVTPYDHPDKYTSEYSVEVLSLHGRYWKHTRSTTATFFTTRPAFLLFRDEFYKHGYIDHARWVEISQNDGHLYSPIPSLATHMVWNFMAPHVNWYGVYNTYLQTSP